MAGTLPNHIDRYQGGSWQRTESEVIVESAISLTVNGELWLTFRCTPVNLEALAVGFLFDEGIIQEKEEIAAVQVCEHGDNIDVWINHRIEKPTTWQRTSGCTGGITALESIYHLPSAGCSKKEVITPEQVNHLVRLLITAQQLYRSAGGVHTSVLSDGVAVTAASEDIGRHNTLDKIAGLCLLQDLVISCTSPSSLSILLAEQMGIVLIGYARGNRFNVYSHPERVLKNGRSEIDLPADRAPLPASREVL
jgi:FdhD protein